MYCVVGKFGFQIHTKQEKFVRDHPMYNSIKVGAVVDMIVW